MPIQPRGNSTPERRAAGRELSAPYAPCDNVEALFPQAQAILEGPPVPVSNRCLADAVEILKVRYRVEREPVFAEPPAPSDALLRLEEAVPFANTSPVCHTPLIMPGGDSVNATFDSSWTLRCDLAPPDSRYAVSGFTVGGDSHLNFFGFTYQGVHSFGFCLDHTKQMPAGAYNNISMEQAMPGVTQTVRLAVSFCIANAPVSPSDYEGGQEFFEMLGLNTCPDLNGYDAYGVIQATIWCLLGQGDPANIRYRIDPNCPSPVAEPKFPCLEAAIDALYNMAYNFAYGSLDCGEGRLPGGAVNGGGAGGGACCNCVSSNYTCGGSGTAADECRCNDPCGLRLGHQLGKVLCCNTGTANTDQTNTYLVFVGCANDLRECCGRVLLGPFKLAASNQGTPTISLTPCDGCQGADITLTDYCCNILASPPTIGQEFYITFRPPCCRFCFDLCAEMETTAIAVYYFRRPNTNALQPIGAPLEFRENRTACIHICIDITPEPPPPEPEPWWEHILVNNNNNNNNNDSNDNNDNNSNTNLLSNMLESLLNNLLSSNLMSGMAGAGAGFGGIGAGLGPGPFPPSPGPFPPGPPFPSGSGPFPPGPGGPNPCGFPFPWGLFPPGTTPCPPPDCGGPNPCCCPPACPQSCCCPCPPPCPPACWCPPPIPPCSPPCPAWPCPCPEPCFLPYPYIPEPNFVIQPASLTYQALPMPVPCFCPPPVPAFPQPFPQMPQPWPSYPPTAQAWDDARQPAQQIYSPVTVVMPSSDPPQQQPAVFMPAADPWVQYSAPPSFLPSFPPPYLPEPMPPQPFQRPFPPPPVDPMPLLLPEFSSAPRPDLTPFETGDYDQFYRDWYGQ